MTTIQDLQQEFYATQLGLNKPWPALADLQYLFYLGVINGDITLGGGTVNTVDDLPARVPATIIYSGSWPARTTVTNDLTRVVIWVGNPGGVAPADMADNDIWTQG